MATQMQPAPQGTTAQARLLLVVGDARLRGLLGYALSSETFVLAVAEDGRTGLECLRREPADLLILDSALPDGSGVVYCQLIRAESSVPLVFLAERADGADGIAALELGADDFVVKPVRLGELLARVRARLRQAPRQNEPPLAEALVVGGLTVYLAARRAFREGRELDLSQKEFDLLALLMRYRGMTVPRDMLLRGVWGAAHPESARTLDVHVHWLRGKIEVDPARPLYIQTVRGVGYRFAER